MITLTGCSTRHQQSMPVAAATAFLGSQHSKHPDNAWPPLAHHCAAAIAATIAAAHQTQQLSADTLPAFAAADDSCTAHKPCMLLLLLLLRSGPAGACVCAHGAAAAEACCTVAERAGLVQALRQARNASSNLRCVGSNLHTATRRHHTPAQSATTPLGVFQHPGQSWLNAAGLDCKSSLQEMQRAIQNARVARMHQPQVHGRGSAGCSGVSCLGCCTG